MAMKSGKLLFLVLIVTALFYAPLPLLGCGPYFAEAIFTHSLHPDFPLEDFARGNLGIAQPTYARSYLYVAYRHLVGMGFDQDEQAALVSLWDGRLYRKWGNDARELKNRWSDIRSTISKAGPMPKINVYYENDQPRYYFLNYAPDAFATAARTLSERVETFGIDSPEVLDWVRAQDMVFDNSSDVARIPEPAKPDAHPIIQADRAYQIAAAHFYARNFDVAERMFREIAADTTSQWRKIASYVVARTLMRKASLSAAYRKIDVIVGTQVEVEIKKILGDGSLTSVHPVAQKQLEHLRFRLYPDEALHELSRGLRVKNAGQSLGDNLSDYTILLDRLGTREGIGDGDDLTDWIITFQRSGDDALEHALEKWNETSSGPWLIASLSKIDGEDRRAAALLKAASGVKQDSPAFPSVAFYSIRTLIRAGQRDEAIEMLDSVLSEHRSTLAPSALNLFLEQRMKVARNLDELLEYAPRVPIAMSLGYGTPIPLRDGSAVDDSGRRVLLDLDSAIVLDRHMPLSLLKEVCVKDSFPPQFRRDLALAAWVKSVLVENEAAGQELAPVLAELVPELKDLLNSYLSAESSETRRYAAVFLMLKFPGVRPFVGYGLGRETLLGGVKNLRRKGTPLGSIDNLRYNWWGTFDPNSKDRTYNPLMGAYVRRLAGVPVVDSPDFLDETQRSTAEDEWQKFSEIDTAPNYLCARVIEWAEQKPDDPRIPEALHLAVRSTQYGWTNNETSDFSRRAFQLLHRRYPKSVWAKKTKYWY